MEYGNLLVVVTISDRLTSEVFNMDKTLPQNAIHLSTCKKLKVLYLRAANTGVDPFRFPNALVVRRHIVKAGVDVEHEEKIADGSNYSNRKVKT